MLWKLADNVKYEDDCEVSVEKGYKERGGKVPFNIGQKFDIQRQEPKGCFIVRQW